MGGGIGRVTHHSDYYLSDGSVSFLASNTLFRVHRSFFERESEVFRELFANAAEDDPPSGTDARPFTLDVKPGDFEKLLWVWYDRDYAYHEQPKQNWVTILRLSTRWKFDKIRELAIRELEALELPPAERISIYNAHNIEGEQLLASYVDMCKSPTVPSPAEGQLIQMETLIKILQAREHAQRKAVELGHESPTSASLEDDALREIVTKLFKTGSSLGPRSNGVATGSGDQALDLNGERAHGAKSSKTITLGEPQVPDRNTAHPTHDLTSRPNNSLPTGSEGKGKPENKTAREKGKMKATQDEKEKEKPEEKEEKPKGEKPKQEKEKEKEKERRAEQRSSQSGRQYPGS